MSSAASIEGSGLRSTAPDPRAADPGLRPWQFFLLAGMLSATGVVLVATGQSAASIIVLSLTVVSASFVALGAYRALAPLAGVGVTDTPVLVVGRTRAALEREKTLALRAIKELEFDYAMKKISASDYEEMGGRLRARALRLMQQLDEGGYRATIEQELAARIAGSVGTDTMATGAAATAATGAPAACSCGTTNDFDARFCKSCGAKLTAA